MTDNNGDEAPACSLTEGEFRDRRALARQTILPHVKKSVRMADGIKLTFNASGPAREKIQEFVDLESQCCGFLTFTVNRITAGSKLELTITAPAEAAGTIDIIEQTIGIHR